MNKRKNWPLYLVGLLFLSQAAIMTAWGERSFVAIHDNLDLFVAHNTMMKKAGIFFAQDAAAPMLGGVSRDMLGGEFTLYNLLYAFLPSYGAYVTGYLLKILIGFWGFLLLAKEAWGEAYGKYRSLAWLVAAGFGMIPVFPAYGIAFTSIPLLLVLLARLDARPGPLLYLLLLAYPALSYFSYIGFFLLAYLALAILVLWGKRRRFPVSLALGLGTLGLGYAACEYRLFRAMLFGGEETIRSAMTVGEYTLAQVIDGALEALADPGFHAQDSHGYLLLPVCLAALVAVNTRWAGRARAKAGARGEGRSPKKLINLTAACIGVNCLIYGLYYYRPFRDLVERLLPPLTGFQFNRTIFLNPFLWHFLFFLCLIWLREVLGRDALPCMLALAGTLVCMLAPQVYNDFYSNLYHHAYELVKGKESSQLAFSEFYSEELFEEIKEDIGYEGEWAAAYGMHPAILQYNGIATLDGYLGMYSLEYKEKFRQVIAPALERSEEFRATFDNLGARAYLYSGAGENTYEPRRELLLSDEKLYIDIEAFRELGGAWLFSRVRLANADELGLTLAGEYGEEAAYRVWVYR